MPGLKETRLFEALEPELLAVLESAAEERRGLLGEVLFHEGDAGDGLFVVLEGVIRISAMVNARDRRVLSRVGAGDFFGEMAVLDQGQRSATAEVEQEARLLFIPQAPVLEVLERSPHLRVVLMREFIHRMRDFNRHYIREVLESERLSMVGRFARSIVHDFKNPLNVINMSAEILGLATATPEMKSGARERIMRQVSRLSVMISELLEFTRGTHGTLALSAVPFHEFVAGVIQELSGEALARGVTVILEGEVPVVTLIADTSRLTHVFANLIHNAVDALMPDGGRVCVRVIAVPTGVRVEVVDTGPGIAADIQGRLFEAFATHGKQNGTGLGLSICRKIIEDHGGTITAANVPGSGACFTFTLPFRPPVSTSKPEAGGRLGAASDPFSRS